MQTDPGKSKSPLITARGLVKSYGSQSAVDAIDFDIHAGRCFGFLGPNGAGKTTTLRMCMGLTPVTSGLLTVFGLPVQQHASAIRARTGIVPQADNLDPEFTVEENLRVYASFFGLTSARVAQRIDRLLAFAALDKRRTARPEALSGGMQRRLTIARALVNEPELVVLDEPTTGLDPQARHLIWGRLHELKQGGKTLLLTTHYMEEAERLCDELVIMDHGRILAQGSPRTLIERYVEPDVIEIRGDTHSATRFPETASCRIEQMGTSVYCYTSTPAALIDSLKNRHELRFVHRPSGLEDVFLRLTGRELRD